LNIIKSIKTTTSCGPDEISTNLLKINEEYIEAPLSYIVNLFFASGIFPSALFSTKIVPIFKKKGSREDKNNYRLIALTSAFSKVIEKMFCR